jgi:hypothetical protein
MGIETKTLGMLTDELDTVNHKLWDEQNKIMDKSLSDTEVANAARKAQTLNKLRNDLIRAIDKTQGQDKYSPTEKTY